MHYEYLVSGTSEHGKRSTSIVEAENADDAVAIMEHQGFGDLVLHTDDLQAKFFQPSRYVKNFKPSEMVAIRTLGRWGFVRFLIRKQFIRAWWLLGMAVAWILLRLSTQQNFGLLDGWFIFMLGLPIALALVSEFTGQKALNRRIQNALVWARWGEVIRLLPRQKDDHLPLFEKPFNRAKALAGQGNLEAALAEIEPLSQEQEMPFDFYWLMKGTICYLAKDKEQALQSVERAVAITDGNPTILLEAAFVFLMLKRDIGRAEELLAQAEKHHLSDMLQPMAKLNRGAIAVDRGRILEGIPDLEQSAESYRAYRRFNPLFANYVARCEAYLAMAYGQLGNRETAKKYLARVAPLLRAQNSFELLYRCEVAVG